MNIFHCECGNAIPLEGTVLDPANCPKCSRTIASNPPPIESLLKPTQRIPLDTHLKLTQRIGHGDRIRLVYGVLAPGFLGYAALAPAWDAAVARIIAAGGLAIVCLSGLRRSWRSLPLVAVGVAFVALSCLRSNGETVRDSLLGLPVYVLLGANYARMRYIDDLRAGGLAAVAGIGTLAVLALLLSLRLSGLHSAPPEDRAWVVGALAALCGATLVAGSIMSVLNRRSRIEAGDAAARVFLVTLMGAGSLLALAILDSREELESSILIALEPALGHILVGLGTADRLLRASFGKLQSPGPVAA